MSKSEKKSTCGIVMPISAIDGCDPGHWLEVKEIISDAISTAGYKANLVSNADDVGVIQARIVQNLYDNEIVVCDVSGKNPNVMFELGLRLAFDKPTIVIKDDKTSYMFDTGQVEYIEYPRDLRFAAITEFKELLSEKIKATVSKAKSDPEYSTFLKHFGKFKVASLGETEVSSQEYLLQELKQIRRDISVLRTSNIRRQNYGTYRHRADGNLDFCLKGMSESDIEMLQSEIENDVFVKKAAIRSIRPGHSHIVITPNADLPQDIVKEVENEVRHKIDALRAI